MSEHLRDTNLARALRLLHRAGGSATRAELARELAVTRATAAALADELVRLGYVTEGPAPRSGRRGRPTTELRPAPRGPVALAVELAAELIVVAEVGLGGRVLDEESSHLGDTGSAAVMAQVRRLVTPRVERLGSRCLGLGVAVHGLVGGADRRVLLAPNLGWRDVPLGRLLRDEWAVPVLVDNDSALAALAETRGSAEPDAETLLFVHSAVGIGGALVVDGRLQRGRAGLAGEYGHLPFGRAGLECRCGARGCWETEVDQRALARAAGRHATQTSAREHAQAVFAAAEGGDSPARRAIGSTAGILGHGLGALVNAFDPHRVVVSGHAADLHRHAPDAVEGAMRAGAMSVYRDGLPPVERTQVRRGALLGAAEGIFGGAFSRPRAGSPRPIP